MPFFTRDRASSAEGSAAQAAAASSSAEPNSLAVRMTEDQTSGAEDQEPPQAVSTPQGEADEPQADTAADISMADPPEKQIAHSSKANGSMAAGGPPHVSDERLGENAVDRSEAGNRHAQSTEVAEALPDSEADEASEAAGLISAEREPQSPHEARPDESIHQGNNSATAGDQLLSEGDRDSHGASPAAVADSSISGLLEAGLADVERSAQEVAEAAMEALSSEAERLEASSPQRLTVVQPFGKSWTKEAEQSPLSQFSPSAPPESLASSLPVGDQQEGDEEAAAAHPSEHESNARVSPAASDSQQPVKNSSASNNSKTVKGSANAIGDMLRSMQKEEWDNG